VYAQQRLGGSNEWQNGIRFHCMSEPHVDR